MQDQFLVIIRGAPASGKTTIAKQLRNFNEKVVWLKVDNYKDFFSDEAALEEQRYVDECAVVTLEYLIDSGFSVVMEKIFYDPAIIPIAIKVAKEKGVKVRTFQIECSLSTLQERDKSRPGVKEGCRRPLGNIVIKKIYKQLEKTFLPDAIKLNTEGTSVEECVNEIRRSLIK